MEEERGGEGTRRRGEEDPGRPGKSGGRRGSGEGEGRQAAAGEKEGAGGEVLLVMSPSPRALPFKIESARAGLSGQYLGQIIRPQIWDSVIHRTRPARPQTTPPQGVQGTCVQE